MVRIVCIMFVLFNCTNSIAQEAAVFHNNTGLLDLIKPESEPNFLYFKSEKAVIANSIFENHKSKFGLGKDDGMVLYKTEKDDIGFTHYRFQQIYKGLKIEGAQFFVHEKNGIVNTASGTMINYLNLDINPVVSEQTALENAVGNDTSAKLLAPTELLIIFKPNGKEFIATNLVLAYKMRLKIQNDIVVFYIDAKTGKILKKEYLIHTCSVGTCQTLYNGQRSFNTRYRGLPNFNYILEDDCHGNGIHTYLGKLNNDVKDSDNNWSLQSERPATSAHWAAGITYDYFMTRHNRSSFNGTGGNIDILADYDVNDYPNLGTNNAFFKAGGGVGNHDLLAFGPGDGGNSTSLATLDVVAHEFTHGITYYTANLNLSYESGALSESYSDIFGEMAEYYLNGTCDYIHGTEHAIDPGEKRSLRNPYEFPSKQNSQGVRLTEHLPDTYHAGYWYYGSGDNGGTHINCGVQNFWFYLLSEGGSGVNDKGQSYSVTGIGKDKAAAITFRSLTQYMGSASGFNAARNHSILAANDLYGSCSNEALQTARAWYAVGVADESPSYNIHVCGNLSGTQTRTAVNLLSAGTNTGCTSTTILNGSNVIFKAANEISFSSEFTVEAGAEFIAYIDPCSITSPYKIGDNNLVNKNENSDSMIMRTETNNPDLHLENSFIIYPNPNNGYFSLSRSSELNQKIAKLIVTDIVGKVVFENNNFFLPQNIDLSSEPKGLYFVKLLDIDNNLNINKVILQ